MKLATVHTILTAVAVGFLGWFPGCEAVLRTAATKQKKELLLRRLRTKQEPFIVSFRVNIKDGPDNEQLAKKLVEGINTPGSDLARTFAYSVARTYNGTFPPVAYPASTTFAPAAAPTALPASALNAFNTTFMTTTQMPRAMINAYEALRIAEENQQAYTDLTKRMTEATAAHADGLVFDDAPGTTPLPTVAPMLANKQTNDLPYTLGRLMYDAFVHTPAPIQMASTTPSLFGALGGPLGSLGAMPGATTMPPGMGPLSGGLAVNGGLSAPTMGAGVPQGGAPMMR